MFLIGIIPGVMVLASYAVLWYADSVPLGRFSSFTPAEWRVWTLGTTITASAYLLLFAAATFEPKPIDYVVFSFFPLIALLWPLAAIQRSVSGTHWAVVIAAAASVFVSTYRVLGRAFSRQD